jgi:tetratricopeptide (TPR) repeat protein
MAALLGVAHRLGSKPQELCSGAGHHLADIWESGGQTSPRKAAIRSAFVATGKSYAEQAYTSVAQLLDQYVGRWTAMYTDACQATHVRGEQSEEVLDLRVACLTERLGNARALSDVLASADGKVVENAVNAAAALPALDGCADVALLRAVVKPPQDPETRKKVDDLRTELARVTALRDSGQCARALPQADALLAKTRAVGYSPLLADALFAAAELGNECGDFSQMLQRFKEAHSFASAGHSDEVAAKAAALIPSYAINRLAQVGVAREWLIVAQSDVARLGRPTIADAMLAQAEGMLAIADRDYDRALAASDRSIATTRKLLGPDHPLTMSWEIGKGDWQAAAGRLEEALKTDIDARQHLERVLGVDHPRTALAWSNQGEVLNLLGRHREAAQAYERAAQLFRQNGAAPVYLAWVLTGLGLARLGEQQPGAALAPLEQALAIRVENHAPKAQLGETRFALARALWARPEGHDRALALARSAREDQEGDEIAVSRIDRWLREPR